MAGAAVFAFNVRKHRKAHRAFLGGREYFGMAQFTAVPDGMLLMREVNRFDPRVSCFNGKILPILHLRRFDRQTFNKIDGFDDPGFLRFLPIDAVNTLWEFRSKLLVPIFPYALFAQ